MTCGRHTRKRPLDFPLNDLLEEVLRLLVVVAEEGHGVGHHPDVASAAVVVRLRPLPVPAHIVSLCAQGQE